MIVGTLGKALGSYGAFVACDRAMARYLINAARTFIFSTAPPPPAVAGALAALELLEERPRRVDKLAANAAALRAQLAQEGFGLGASRTQIIPLIVGEAGLAIRICEAALSRGVFAQAIRPPTVPAMTSRLRLAVMASHREEELRSAARILAQSARASGFEPQTHAPRRRQTPVPAAEEPARRRQTAVPAAEDPGRRPPRTRTAGADLDYDADRFEEQVPAPRATVFDFEAPETRAA